MKELWEKEPQTRVSEFEDHFTFIGKRVKIRKCDSLVSLDSISVADLSLQRNLSPLKNSRTFGSKGAQFHFFLHGVMVYFLICCFFKAIPL